MSLWTDRELKALIARVGELEKRIIELEDSATKPAKEQPDFVKIDKRTKEWKLANSQQ